MSRMSSAWISENENGASCSASRAAARSSDARIQGDDGVDHVERPQPALEMWARSRAFWPGGTRSAGG